MSEVTNYFYESFASILDEDINDSIALLNTGSPTIEGFCKNYDYDLDDWYKIIKGDSPPPNNGKELLDFFNYFEIHPQSEPAKKLILAAIYSYIPRDLLDLHIHISSKLEMMI